MSPILSWGIKEEWKHQRVERGALSACDHCERESIIMSFPVLQKPSVWLMRTQTPVVQQPNGCRCGLRQQKRKSGTRGTQLWRQAWRTAAADGRNPHEEAACTRAAQVRRGWRGQKPDRKESIEDRGINGTVQWLEDGAETGLESTEDLLGKTWKVRPTDSAEAKVGRILRTDRADVIFPSILRRN